MTHVATYPGNPSLPPEVRERILSTFQHTLRLFREGKMQEVAVGCEFVLKMDPLFSPAKDLLGASRNPAASVDLDAMEALAAPRTAASDPAILLAEALRLFEAREFPRAVVLAGRALKADPGNLEAKNLLGRAEERIEAAPFIAQFVRKAQQAIGEGDSEKASRELDKARALDDGNPEIAALEEKLQAGTVAQPEFSSFSFDVSETEGAGDFSWEKPEESPAAFAPPATPFEFEEENAIPPSAARMEDEPFSLGTAEPGPIGFESPLAAPEQGGLDAQAREKISSLLREGDECFAAGSHQKAIDLWSRIFLIDVTHSEASDRIERAKLANEEQFREADAVYHQAVRLNDEKGDVTGAREMLENLLRQFPGHAPSREYLDAMTSVRVTGRAPASATSNRPKEVTLPPPTLSEDIFAEEMSTTPGLGSDILMPPDFEDAGMEGPEVGMPAALARKVQADLTAKFARKDRKVPVKFLVIAGALLAVVLGAGAFLFFNKGKLFPNTAPEDKGATGDQQAAATAMLIETAQKLGASGKVGQAIAELSKVPLDDPRHDEVLRLMELLKSRAAPAPGFAAGGSGKGTISPEVAAELTRMAREAFAAKKYLDAVEGFNRAAKVLPLGSEEQEMLSQAQEQLTKIQGALRLYNEGQYPAALPVLWRLHEEDPENQDVRQYLVNCYYNLSVASLQAEDVREALTSLKEAQGLAPADQEIVRQKEFAEKYSRQALDLLYRIYVKNLPLR